MLRNLQLAWGVFTEALQQLGCVVVHNEQIDTGYSGDADVWTPALAAQQFPHAPHDII